jgi:hypothetical protein
MLGIMPQEREHIRWPSNTSNLSSRHARLIRSSRNPNMVSDLHFRPGNSSILLASIGPREKRKATRECLILSLILLSTQDLFTFSVCGCCRTSSPKIRAGHVTTETDSTIQLGKTTLYVTQPGSKAAFTENVQVSTAVVKE